jgi:protoheme IX farnesyltransferase
VVHAVIGTALLIVGAAAMNQRLESRSDAKMKRTSRRPLPAGSLTPGQVTSVGMVASTVGIVYLVACVGPVAAAIAGSSWLIYVVVYTPLKSVTVWQTPVGAVSGAMPILIGTATVGSLLSPISGVLFGIVFFWQFPHTMAIAWLHRQEYAAGKIRVATVVDPTGKSAGLLAVLGAACLLAVSLIPAVCSWGAWPLGIVAGLAGVIGLILAVRFLLHPTDSNARAMRYLSMIHLPGLLIALLSAAR